MNIFKKTLVLLIIIITLYILFVLYNTRMQIKSTMTEGFDVNEMNKEFENVRKGDIPSLGAFQSSNYDENIGLKQFCIKASYNTAYTGDKFVNLDMVSHVIEHGCRFLDFEIYAFDGEPFVAYSTDKENIITSNKLTLSEVLSRVDENAFTADTGNFTTPNPTDPMFIHFRIISNYKESFYTKVNQQVQSILGAKMYKNDASQDMVNRDTSIRSLNGKYIIIYNTISSDEYFEGNSLLTKNMESNSNTLKMMYAENRLAVQVEPPNIINDGSFSRVDVNDYQMTIPNNGRGFSYFFYYDNPDSGELIRYYGVQIVCMKFYINNNIESYEKLFSKLGAAIVPMSNSINYFKDL